tara:strand:+ start:1651 stop:2748 length:1098 start_codon:yes stop_codon:yes gene_type:complete
MKNNSPNNMRRAAGMTLIEILVAVAILATFVLPVYGLYMMNTRNRDFLRAWDNALDISSNIMERLLSEDVPFLAIEPEGYISDEGKDTKAILANNRAQADFRESFGTLDFQSYNLKSILGASKGGDYRVDDDGDRIITKGGIDFKILLWAGIYADDPNSPSTTTDLTYKHNADPTRELTFSYYPNPWFDPNNDCAENNASNDSLSAQINSVSAASNCARNDQRPINPYRQVSGNASGLASNLFYQNGIDDPMNDSFRHGFPVVGSYAWGGEGQAANNTQDKEWNESPDPANSMVPTPINQPYNPRYEDKAFHNFEDINSDGDDDGALMKIVLGLHWVPRKWGSKPQARQEYYLISFKANLLTAVE